MGVVPDGYPTIINLSKTQELVTVMWANEQFDAAHPDTFYENVLLEDRPVDPEKGNL